MVFTEGAGVALVDKDTVFGDSRERVARVDYLTDGSALRNVSEYSLGLETQRTYCGSFDGLDTETV